MRFVFSGKIPSDFQPSGRLPSGKRVFDISVSIALIVVLIPAFLVIALAIKWDMPGPVSSRPVLFRQTRTGRHGQLFVIYKFQTLCPCDPNSSLRPITPFCQFLRRWGFDELPQLFNVIRGDMSLVGPRPHTPKDNQNFVRHFSDYSEYDERHLVRPGITGLAQLNGWRGTIRNTANLQGRIALDIQYVRNRSIITDIIILFQTIVMPRRWLDGPYKNSNTDLFSSNYRRAG